MIRRHWLAVSARFWPDNHISMARHEGLALILSVADYRESSHLLQVLSSEEGRISLIVKGTRSSSRSSSRTAQAAMLQPFSLVYLDYMLKDEKSLGTINRAEIERIWKAPRENLSAYAHAAYWFEILKSVSQARSRMPELFDLTVRYLEFLESNPSATTQNLVWLSDLSDKIGFRWNYQTCSQCGKPLDYNKTVQFSLKSGFLCQYCLSGHNAMPVTEKEKFLLNALQSSRATQPGSFQREYADLTSLLNRFLVYHLEGPLKSFTFLQQTISP